MTDSQRLAILETRFNGHQLAIEGHLMEQIDVAEAQVAAAKALLDAYNAQWVKIPRSGVYHIRKEGDNRVFGATLCEADSTTFDIGPSDEPTSWFKACTDIRMECCGDCGALQARA